MIDNVLLMGIGGYSTVFLSVVQFSMFWHTFSVNFLLRKYIIHNLNNTDMVLLRTSYRHGGFLNFILNCNLVRFGLYMAKLCLEKMLILRCIHPPKKTTSRKRLTPIP